MADRCDALWDEADPKSEVVAAGLLEMGASSVAVPEVGVNIGGSIADADEGVCSVSDEEGAPLPPRSMSTSSSPAWWKKRTNLVAPVVD